MLLSSHSLPRQSESPKSLEKVELREYVYHTYQLKLGYTWFRHRHTGAAHVFR